MRLAVELYGTTFGTLEGDNGGFDFAANPDGIGRFGANSTVLSVAISLAPQQRKDHAARRRNWFTELLPEGDQYNHMLAQAGLRAGDTLGFLARYGRDVAGALQLWDLDDPSEPPIPVATPVTANRVRAMLEDPIGAPLGNEGPTGKTSLAGVQPKIVLARTGTGWARVAGGHPSTHILKPRLEGNNATVIYDEEFGSRLARRLGLAGFAAWIENFDGLDALVIERYDRAAGGDGAGGDGAGADRIHQEDLSQALGASRNQKYQEMGGVVTLQRVAQTLKRHAPASDLLLLARMVTVSVATGNLDMHTKNLSLLHPADGGVRLAPAYDAVPQAHQNNDGKLALAVNDVYRHRDVTAEDLAAEFAGWGLRGAAGIVSSTLDELGGALLDETPLAGAFEQLHDQISAFVEALAAGSPAGQPSGRASSPHPPT